MAVAQKKETRYTKAAIGKKVKPGGRRVVSSALIKPSATNLVPKMHVKRGDTVVLISGPTKNGKYSSELKKRLEERNAYKGQIGKVSAVSPSTGKITIEGVNIVTRAQKQRSLTGKSGLVTKEAPIFASRVMLYCNNCKKATRVKHKIADGKKTRICRHCSESLDA